MKKNIALILAILSAVLLFGSFPVNWIIGDVACDICRFVGFILLFVVTGLRIFPKKQPKDSGE